jgi:hypothetical protein
VPISARWLATILTLAALRDSSLAAAQAAPSAACNGPIVRASARLTAEWSAALDTLQQRLRSLPDVDRCAEVDLVPQASHVEVLIRLADGRIAVREVNTPAEAIPAVEALLTTLPDRALANASKAEPASRSATKPAERTADERAKTSARVVAIDVGLGASLHIAGRPWFLGYGLAGHVSVAINQWLLGSWLRWDIRDRLLEGELPRGLVASSFLLGAFTGRRVSLGRAMLDVIVGPNLVVETEEAAGTEGIDVGGEVGSLSLGAALRLFVPRSSPSFFVLCGGDVIPSRLKHAMGADPTLPALPAWSATLVLGAAWTGL